MIHPTPGELLASVADTLATIVEPTVADEHARRQLRAATHVLRRLAATWDLYPRGVADDVTDMSATLRTIEGLLNGHVSQRLSDADATFQDVEGFNEPGLQALARDHARLQGELERLNGVIHTQGLREVPPARQRQIGSHLRDLYERMLWRQQRSMNGTGLPPDLRTPPSTDRVEGP